jgi:hypothetical protein
MPSFLKSEYKMGSKDVRSSMKQALEEYWNEVIQIVTDTQGQFQLCSISDVCLFLFFFNLMSGHSGNSWSLLLPSQDVELQHLMAPQLLQLLWRNWEVWNAEPYFLHITTLWWRTSGIHHMSSWATWLVSPSWRPFDYFLPIPCKE